MRQICQHCNKETDGFLLKFNGEKYFICHDCKTQSVYIPFVHPNRNDKYTGIICPDFEGSHNSTYGKDYN